MDATHTFAPPAWRIAAYAAGGLLLGGFTVTLDAAGRLLVGLAAVGLLVTAALDAVRRPALAAGPLGLEVVVGFGRRYLPWAAVKGVRAETVSRAGRVVHMTTLEIDAGDELIVLSRRQLGADPARVAEVAEEIRMRSVTE